jgi:hypothetical protein
MWWVWLACVAASTTTDKDPTTQPSTDGASPTIPTSDSDTGSTETYGPGPIPTDTGG